MRISDWSSDVCSSDLTGVWKSTSSTRHPISRRRSEVEMPISGHSAWLINTNPAVVDHDGVGLDRNLTWKGLCRSSADVERATMKRTFDDAAILLFLGQHGVSIDRKSKRLNSSH